MTQNFIVLKPCTLCKCSKKDLLTTSFGLCWSVSASVLHWGAPSWTEYSRRGLRSVEYEVTDTSLDLLATFGLIQPVCGWPSLPQGHDAGSCSACHPPEPLVFLCKDTLQPVLVLRGNYVPGNLSLRLCCLS